MGAKIEEVDKRFPDVEGKYTEIENELITNSTKIAELQKLRATVNSHKTELERNMTKVWKKFEKCWDVIRLHEHKTQIQTVVESWQKQIQGFRGEIDVAKREVDEAKKDVSDAKSIIRRFDEVILEKASKFELQAIKVS